MNSYSTKWFSTFLDSVPLSQTLAEIDLLKKWMPLAEFPRILDVCCGSGRHLVPLTEAGYGLVGVDRDEGSLAVLKEKLQSQNLNANILRQDMRLLDFRNSHFDAVMCLWQSFGFFDAEMNENVIAGFRRVIKSKGRLVLDIYNRDFFEGKDGVFVGERNGIKIQETRRILGDFLYNTIEYENGEQDQFQWQIFNLKQIEAFCLRYGFRLLYSCSRFNETKPVSASAPRMQLLFMRE